MLTRYARPEMVAVWTPERRFQIMLEVELLACEAMETRGEVPPGTDCSFLQLQIVHYRNAPPRIFEVLG